MQYITEDHYNNLTLIQPDLVFAYVYDATLGSGTYTGFDPMAGYTYEFDGETHHGVDFKPMTTIIALQNTPFTGEQIKLLEEKVNEGYI